MSIDVVEHVRDTPRRPLSGLRSVLVHQGRSPVWLARRLGVVRPRVHDWASGRRLPPVGTAERIADILGVPVAVLYLGNSDQRVAS